MSPVAVGALLGAVAGAAVLMVVLRLTAGRQSGVAVRVLPYVHDLPVGRPALSSSTTRGQWVERAARRIDDLLGGATSVRRRLERAGVDADVHDFRVEQVVWGLGFFTGAAGLSVLLVAGSADRAGPLVIVCFLAFVFGVLLRDNRLTAQVVARERQMLLEFPTIAELLALSVAAGEGPVSAIERVVGRSRGALPEELARVLVAVRTGTPVHAALDALAARTGLPIVARFASGLAVAIERGTPLADVLHAQAADVREAGRRELIESGARREVLMMVPVVFLVLPVTVFFAFWPGVVGLDLVAP